MISVIIPTYNRAKTLARSIDSILHQTYNDIECIIIDDASTDNTLDIVNEYSDSRLRYIRVENQKGACSARNLGIKISKGRYIAFQDSDDYWLPNKLERQLTFMESSSADIVFCQMISKNLVTGREFYFPANSFRDKDITVQRIYAENFASTQTILGKKECFERHQFDIALPRFQDWDLVMRLVTDFKVHYLQEVLVHAYVNADSISSNPAKGIKACDYLFDKWKDVYERYPRSAAKLYSMKILLEIQNGDDPGEDIVLQINKDPYNYRLWIKKLLYHMGLLSHYYMRK